MYAFLDLYKAAFEAAFIPLVAVGDFWTNLFVSEAINSLERK